ncbi:MAG: murein biosynthesis integral membrane protein MurJ [Pseudomonadota bacterium]
MNLEHHKISRRVGTVSFFTFLSRIMGLVRDMVMASVFGATNFADAFYVAFRIPNLLRRLTAEGALTIAFVPVFTEYLKKSRLDARVVASVVFTYLSLILVAISLLGILFAPIIIKVMAYGFTHEPQKYELTVYLTRLMFPYVILVSLVALAMGILNSMKHFAAPAAAPVVLNLGIIFGALVLSKLFNISIIGAAFGVLVGGMLQLIMQIPVLQREGMLPKFSFKPHPAMKSLLLLMIPSALGAAVYQVNVLVVTLLASFLPEGSISYLWFGDRLAEFPLGIFGIAIATAALPSLSDQASNRDMVSFRETINYSLRLSFLITIPAAVGLFILALPIVKLLFQRGKFNAATASATALTLQYFALKIPFVSAVRNLVPGFFALRDAKTPVYVSTAVVALNALVAFILMQYLSYAGLALALAISSAFNYFTLFYLFRRKVGLLGGKRLMVSIIKTLLCSIVMAIVLYIGDIWIDIGAEVSTWILMFKLLLTITIGIVIYISIIRLVSPNEFRALAAIVRSRRK